MEEGFGRGGGGWICVEGSENEERDCNMNEFTYADPPVTRTFRPLSSYGIVVDVVFREDWDDE